MNNEYLAPKGFERINDTVFIHPNSKEIFSLLSSRVKNQYFIYFNYFTNSKLDKIRKQLQSESMNFKKINDNLYEQTHKKYKLQFILENNVEIDGRKMNALKGVLQYEVGTKFDSNSNYNFKFVRDYPFQNSTWYFDVICKNSKNYSDIFVVDINLTKEKTPYKIDFIDDKNFKVTYLDRNKKAKIFSGTYSSGQDISFTYPYPVSEKITKNAKGETMKLTTLPPVLYLDNAEDLNKTKDSVDYFYFLFNKSYEWNLSSSSTINFSNSVHVGNPRETMPAPANYETRK